MIKLFTIDARHHGSGPILFDWHPQGTYVASTGQSRVVHIFDSKGKLIDQIVPPHPSAVAALEWDRRGEILAIMQQQSAVVLLWELQTKNQQQITTPVKDLSFLKWSKVGSQLAMGTGKGSVVIYDRDTDQLIEAESKHKKRIVCGDWNLDNKFAYASEDRQITICDEKGITMDQVKLKSRPINVTFGGKQDDQECVVSVNMDGKAILLYDLKNRDNALELAFQPRYGSIVSYKWFGDGFMMAGFSSGYVVVISTHMHEIGREQFCAKFHSDQLRDLAHCPKATRVATCGDNCVKLIDMNDWKEVTTEVLEREAGLLDRLAWAKRGQILSVSSQSGCLYNFMVQSAGLASLVSIVNQPQVYAAASLIFKPLAPVEAIVCLFIVLLTALLALQHSLGGSMHDIALALQAGVPTV